MIGQGYGVVCEVTRDSVKLFDFDKKEMVVMEAPRRNTVHIGDIRQTSNRALSKVGPGMVHMSSDDFAEDRNGSLLVKAMVVCPKHGSLEKELVGYESRVFSYLFGFVHDPSRHLTEVFRKGGFRWVMLRYSPQDDYCFEIVRRLETAEIPGAKKNQEKEQPEVKREDVFRVPELPVGGRPGSFKIRPNQH
ncbi:unnamed protein product [Caenorhabditis brenneri]